MKKAFAMMVLAVAMVANVAAQSVTTPNSKLQLQVKGVEYKNHNAEITVLISNQSDDEIMLNLVGGQYQTGMAGSIAYDDDGNVYELGNVQVSMANKSFTEQYCGINLPSKVPVKCHILIKNVNEAATELMKIKLCILCPALAINNTGVCFEINHVSLK